MDMAAPGAAPASDTVDPAMAGDAPADGAGQNVLMTVLDNGDGTYTLVQGDEGEGPAAVAGSPEGGAAIGGEAPQGQTFDSIGALLKGMMDVLKAHEESAGGEGTADENFDAGFKGGSSASPARPTVGASAGVGGGM